MFKNFLTTLTRHLWRNRLFTILNVVGLSVCICVAWIIFRIVSYEYSFDKNFPDGQDIYQVVSKSNDADNPKESGFSGVSTPVYNTLKNDVTGAGTVVPMFYKYQHKAVSREEDNKPVEHYGKNDDDIQLVSTTSDYFSLLGYHWLAGNSKTALDAPDKIVLTSTKAQEYFPNLDPTKIVGKTIVFDDTVIRRVSGIVAQLNFPNSFSADNNQFIPLDKEDLTDNNWGGMNSNYLIFIKPAKNASTQRIMDQLNTINTKYNQEAFEKFKYKTWYDVLPLNQKHFEAQFGAQTRTANKKVLNGLMITGAFLLLLACINYINLSTAMLPQRAKEIGIRKTLGSSSRDLILRFISETFVVTVFASLLSFGLTAFAVRIFSDFLPEGLSDFMNYPSMIGFLFSLIIIVSLIAGLYPAWLSSRVNTVNVLKGSTERVIGSHRFSLRKAMIVFQFLIAQIFIIGSMVVYQQLNFALHKDLGFNKEGIITVEVPYYVRNDPKYKDKQFVLRNELLKKPSIQGISLGNRPMDNMMMGNLLTYYKNTTEIQKQVNMKFADTDYLKLYGFHLLAGRNFVASDTMNELVINEAASKAYGFQTPEDAIGKTLVNPHAKPIAYPIVGVVADFNQFGIKTKIEPVLITTSKKYGSSILNIKLSKDESKWKRSISGIEKEWKKLYAGVPFQYSFYDETVKKFYQEEEKTQTLVSSATLIAILISCLGLSGLATLTAFQRTKEIGVRKVLGASVAGIVQLLSKEFLSLDLISVLIASPISWRMMNKWLQDYAYRIDIKWRVFAGAAILASVIALLTVSYQAIKAAKANPVESLCTE